MPWFFQYSKNGRRGNESAKAKAAKCAPCNRSTMNRISKAFDDIGNMNMNLAGVDPFNWQMLLMNEDYEYSERAVELFCQMDEEINNIRLNASEMYDAKDKANIWSSNFLQNEVLNYFSEEFDDIYLVYSSVVKYLFCGDGVNKEYKKRTFWNIFGHLAYEILTENMNNYTVCKKCGTKVPAWASTHSCSAQKQGLITCVDCGCLFERTGPRSCRCKECSDRRKILMDKLRVTKFRKKE